MMIFARSLSNSLSIAGRLLTNLRNKNTLGTGKKAFSGEINDWVGSFKTMVKEG